MLKRFRELCGGTTYIESCSKFLVINYRELSDGSLSRLSSVSELDTDEPYILEIVSKQGDKKEYKSMSFENLDDAIKLQKELIGSLQ